MENSALCGGAAKNLGQPSNVCELGIMSKACFVAQTASDGTKNSIDITDTVDATYVSGMVQTGDKTNVSKIDDPSKRWFPTTAVKQAGSVRDEQNTEEIDGFSYVTSEGVRNVTFTIVTGATPQLYGAYKSREDLIDAFYTFSVDEQIGGNGRTAGILQPIRIEPKTFKVLFVPANKSEETSAKIIVSFALSSLEKDEDIAFLAQGDGCMASDVIITDAEGLVDVTLAVDTTVTVTTTTVTVDGSFIYGSQAKKSPWTGGVAADFTFDGSPITSVTETVDGKYEIVFPTASSGDYNLTVFKAGFYAETIVVTVP